MAAKALDYVSLGISTFFVENLDTSEDISFSPSMLWLYFAAPPVRAVCFAGFAVKITLDSILKNSFTIKSVFAIGLFSCTAYLNFPKLFVEPNEKTDYGQWRQSATEGMGWMGSWWIGGGNGEWFGFFGHNGSGEKTILPASLLEQMSVMKKSPDENNIIIVEEINEDE